MKNQADTLYDPDSGSRLLRIREAAEYLDYSPISLYRIVAKGDLKPIRAGKTLFFHREDLDRYKLQNRWAARKAQVERPKEEIPLPPTKLKAEVAVDFLGGVLGTSAEKIEDFSWDMIPEIRARLDRKYGSVRFGIQVSSPDGGLWSIEYQPPTWLDKLKARVRR